MLIKKEEQKYESEVWWYKARFEFIKFLVRRYAKNVNKQTKIVDIGAGISSLQRCFNSKVNYFPFDKYFHNEGRTNFCYGDITQMPYKPESFDIAFVFDILEHIEDDKTAFDEVVAIVKKEGLIFLSVPMYPLLWSKRDIDIAHLRRYTEKNLKKLIKRKKQMKLVKECYWNSLLLMPVLILALLQRPWLKKRLRKNTNHKKVISYDNEKIWPRLNWQRLNSFLLGFLRFENMLIQNKLKLPFGISKFIILRKKS